MPNSLYFDVVFAVDGDLTPVPDAVQPSGSISYSQGWGPFYAQDPTVNPSTALFIDRAQTNQLFNDVTGAIQQLQQNSVPPFITSAMNNGSPYTYGAGVQVILSGVIYQSLVASNADTPPSSKWQVMPGNSGVLFSGGTSGGSANAQTVASTQGNWTNANKNIITWISGFSVTGASTLSVDSQTAKTIKVRTPGGLADTVSGDIVANQEYMAIYDGTILQLLTPSLPQAFGIFNNMKITPFTGNGTWTPDAKNILTIVGFCASGGSGGGVSAGGAAEAGGGGAGGGGAWVMLTASQAGASQSVTIGAAATGATAGNNDGNAGNSTSIGSLMSATGGGAGHKAPNPGSDGESAGGTGGTPSVSTGTLMVAINGQDGGNGMYNFLSVGGMGGNSIFGFGGAQVGGNGITNQPGQAGKGYGSGSGGASDGVGGFAEGTAASQPGFAIFIEFLHP